MTPRKPRKHKPIKTTAKDTGLPWKWIGIGAVAAVVAALSLMLPVREWAAMMEDRLEQMNLALALGVFVAVYVVATLILIPSWIFPIAAGVVFGFAWGTAVTIVGATLGSVAAFIIGRYFLHGFVERAANRNPAFKAVDKAVEKEPWKVVALLRLSPLFPSPVKSYFLGLTCVRLKAYTIASTVGMIPGLLLKVYIGSAGRGALGNTSGPMKWLLLGTGVAATIAVTVVIGRMAKKKLNLGV